MGARSFPRLAAFLCYASLGPSFQGQPSAPSHGQRALGTVTPFLCEPEVSRSGLLVWPPRWRRPKAAGRRHDDGRAGDVLTWRAWPPGASPRGPHGTVVPQNRRRQPSTYRQRAPGLVPGQRPSPCWGAPSPCWGSRPPGAGGSGDRAKPCCQHEDSRASDPSPIGFGVFFFPSLAFNKQIVPPSYSDVLLPQSCISH